VVAGRRRRIYHPTLAGEAALAEQAAQWREFSGSMARVLSASIARALAASTAAVLGTGPAAGLPGGTA
jgi:DNA-binding PadR family transcriptional regulator